MKIALDTNVLVRYITWDDPEQAEEAASVIESGDVLVVPIIVLCELVWVLRRRYRYDAGDIIGAIRTLIEARSVEVDRVSAEAGLAMLAKGGDFADGVIQGEALAASCTKLATFDRTFAARANQGFALIPGES